MKGGSPINVQDSNTTEKRNPHTLLLDQMKTIEILQTMNTENSTVDGVIKDLLPTINQAVIEIIHSFKTGGRLIYIGAGTSGRIGLLDASECPPTFGVHPEQVVGVMAGGINAFQSAQEGLEDSQQLGKKDLQTISLTEKDSVVGLSASGKTPYVIGALQYAKEIGAATISIACNKNAPVTKVAKVGIEADCGPEVLTGSTRLKAGTAQKNICNMLSTASMAAIGKVYSNLMVDVQPTNKKLIARSKRIIAEAAGCDLQTAENYFIQSGKQTKIAIIMLLTKVTKEKAQELLRQHNGIIGNAIRPSK